MYWIAFAAVYKRSKMDVKFKTTDLFATKVAGVESDAFIGERWTKVKHGDLITELNQPFNKMTTKKSTSSNDETFLSLKHIMADVT